MSATITFAEKHRRIIGLDIIRSVAILLVLYAHGAMVLPEEFHASYYSFMPKLDGVSIFFVLSGFLIGGIMLKTVEATQFTTKDLLNFWVRRWFRTLPNYFLVLVLIAGYHLVIFRRPPPDFSWDFVFFLQNFAWPHPLFFQEAWSLAVEEWFYLLFPLAYFILNRCIKKKTSALYYNVIGFFSYPFNNKNTKAYIWLGIAGF